MPSRGNAENWYAGAMLLFVYALLYLGGKCNYKTPHVYAVPHMQFCYMHLFLCVFSYNITNI